MSQKIGAKPGEKTITFIPIKYYCMVDLDNAKYGEGGFVEGSHIFRFVERCIETNVYDFDSKPNVSVVSRVEKIFDDSDKQSQARTDAIIKEVDKIINKS